MDLSFPEALGALGVDADATLAEAKAAYRVLVKRLHPDTGAPVSESPGILTVTLAWEIVQRELRAAPSATKVAANDDPSRERPPPVRPRSNRDDVQADDDYLFRSDLFAVRVTEVHLDAVARRVALERNELRADLAWSALIAQWEATTRSPEPNAAMGTGRSDYSDYYDDLFRRQVEWHRSLTLADFAEDQPLRAPPEPMGCVLLESLDKKSLRRLASRNGVKFGLGASRRSLGAWTAGTYDLDSVRVRPGGSRLPLRPSPQVESALGILRRSLRSDLSLEHELAGLDLDVLTEARWWWTLQSTNQDLLDPGSRKNLDLRGTVDEALSSLILRRRQASQT